LKITYRQISRDDVIRQFRYYLVALDRPDVALRFRESVRKTVKAISARPLIAPLYPLANPRLLTLPSWPVAGFETIRIYFLLDSDDD
jgi:hypothetical protein